jgi:hypothetical protein
MEPKIQQVLDGCQSGQKKVRAEESQARRKPGQNRDRPEESQARNPLLFCANPIF